MYFYRHLEISYSHFPPNFNGLEEQLLTMQKVPVPQGEETREEVHNHLPFKYLMMTYLDEFSFHSSWNPKILQTQRNRRPDRYSGDLGKDSW
nr:hypothetical protein HmN_000059900 [Hymenolepis microstoma]